MAAAGPPAPFDNAPSLLQLLDALAHPVGQQPPALRHFTIPAEAPEGSPQHHPATAGAVRAPPPGVTAAAILAATLLLAGMSVRSWLRRRSGGAARHAGLDPVPARRRGRRRLVPILLNLIAAIAVLGPAAPPSAGPGQRAQHPPAAAASSAAEISDSDRPVVRSTSDPWTQLVVLEAQLDRQAHQLNDQEATLRHYAASAANAATAPVAGVLSAHQQTATAHQAALVSEYQLYRRLAADPALRRDVLAAAGSAGAAAQDAVTSNLAAVELQLDQENAIATAEQRLRQPGGIGAALDALSPQPLIAPLAGELTQPFGPTDFAAEPPLSFQGTLYAHFHTGIDLAAPLDTPVHAAADGVVLLTASSTSGGHLVGYGNYVMLAHPGGLVTLYGHLDRITAVEGALVHQGDVIGLEGSTGNSTGPHVHFEVRSGTALLDPAAVLARGANRVYAASSGGSFTIDSDLTQPSGLNAEQIDAWLSGTPLAGLGGAFVAAERDQHVSARYLVAHAVLESDWGHSRIATDKHNLFGFGADDTNPYRDAASFTSFAECVAEVAHSVAVSYLSAGGSHFHGPTLRGMNVDYASDPLWDQKIAVIAQTLPAA